MVDEGTSKPARDRTLIERIESLEQVQRAASETLQEHLDAIREICRVLGIPDPLDRDRPRVLRG